MVVSHEIEEINIENVFRDNLFLKSFENINITYQFVSLDVINFRPIRARVNFRQAFPIYKQNKRKISQYESTSKKKKKIKILSTLLRIKSNN